MRRRIAVAIRAVVHHGSGDKRTAVHTHVGIRCAGDFGLDAQVSSTTGVYTHA